MSNSTYEFATRIDEFATTPTISGSIRMHSPHVAMESPTLLMISLGMRMHSGHVLTNSQHLVMLCPNMYELTHVGYAFADTNVGTRNVYTMGANLGIVERWGNDVMSSYTTHTTNQNMRIKT